MHIFLCVMAMLIPLTMVAIGAYWKGNAPKKVNWIYGYRTTMSMKNEETWAFAHRYHAQVWLWSGVILAALSLISLIAVIALNNESMLEQYIGIIMVVQCTVLVLSIIPTEIALRKHFDADGNPRL